ncbi:MAG: SMP-30/gluconolactonase/LRE family protein [Spirochaetia bacterium]|jgi:D-xylonolactonase
MSIPVKSASAPSSSPEVVADYACVCGEGPLWHPTEKKVYWVDIPQGRLFRFDPAAGKHEKAFQWEGQIGGFTVQADGSLLLFMDRGAVRVLRDGQLHTIMEQIPGEENGRFNDVIADPEGRVFCGTLPADDHKGSLYRLDANGKLTKLLEGIGCSNGMGFTPDHAGLYYVDSTTRVVSLFDYEASTGEIGRPRVFSQLPESLGVPDGMTVDAKGFVWVAVWGGSCVLRFAPDGREERRIYFTAKLVSSVIFAGDDYRDMYVTTAGGDNKKDNGPSAGALFRVRSGIKGVPEFSSRIGI